MKATNQGVRLNLSNETSSHLEGAKNYLRSRSCRVTNSKIAEWVINRYFEKYFEQEKKVMESSFFDEKVYLKKLLADSGNQEELASGLKDLVSKISQSKTKRAKKKKPSPSINQTMNEQNS